jgi:hypothetical protein
MSTGSKIGPNDVLLGRGGYNYKHSGNESFRELAKSLAQRYMISSKTEKSRISKEMVNNVLKKDPPGRFLKRIKEGVYEEVGFIVAREKASQCLRDASAALTAGTTTDFDSGTSGEHLSSSITMHQSSSAAMHPPRATATPNFYPRHQYLDNETSMASFQNYNNAHQRRQQHYGGMPNVPHLHDRSNNSGFDQHVHPMYNRSHDHHNRPPYISPDYQSSSYTSHHQHHQYTNPHSPSNPSLMSQPTNSMTNSMPPLTYPGHIPSHTPSPQMAAARIPSQVNVPRTSASYPVSNPFEQLRSPPRKRRPNVHTSPSHFSTPDSEKRKGKQKIPEKDSRSETEKRKGGTGSSPIGYVFSDDFKDWKIKGKSPSPSSTSARRVRSKSFDEAAKSNSPDSSKGGSKMAKSKSFENFDLFHCQSTSLSVDSIDSFTTSL